MAKLIQVGEPKEGEILCKWMHSRLIRNNKNVLGANLGATGSGKSYRDLRMAELWYDYHFHEKFPPENICFGVVNIMRRLSSGTLRRGEVLIFEESGVNMGSLDFQNRVSKMFSYVLQSFRSMNIAIFFNLPYLSMLNKTARMLMHYSMESVGIDQENKINKCKFFTHQVNQRSGKVYSRYPKVRVHGKMKQVKRFNFSLPSKELRDAYEAKKIQFLSDTTREYTLELEKLEEDKLIKSGRPLLTEKQQAVYKLACQGLNQKEIAKIRGIDPSTVCETLQYVKKKGYLVEIKENPKEKGEYGAMHTPIPFLN